MSRLAGLPGAALLFLLAAALRCLTAPSLFLGDRMLLFGHDAYYHLRRILFSAANFPASLGFDPYLAFPHGGQPIWTPVFDWCLAALARLTIGPEHPPSVERLASAIPPLLGALGVGLVYALLQRRLSRPAALAAALLLAVLPAHAWYSRVGFVDHHALVALAAVGLLAAALRFLERTRPGAVERRGARGASVWLGVALGGALLVWPGAILHVGVAEIGLLVPILRDPDAPRAARGLRLLALANAVAALVVAPLSLGSDWIRWGAFSPVVLSHFQPWLFASAAGGLLLTARAGRAAGSRMLRAAVLAGLGSAALLLTGLLAPSFLPSLGEAWAWMAREEAFQAQVSESAPLFGSPSQWSAEYAELLLSRFVYLAPLAAWALARRPQPVPRFLAWWATAFLLAAIVQSRFANTASIGVAILGGWSAVELHRRARRALPEHPAARPALVLASILALGLLLQPVLPAYSFDLWNGLRVLRGMAPVPRPTATAERQRLALALGEWLREHSPPAPGFLDPDAAPELGVLADWEIGHVLRYAARRPMVVDNFGDDIHPENFELARAYFGAESEAEALRILERLRVRYVVASEEGSGLPEALGRRTLLSSLVLLDGAAGRLPGRRGAMPALERHRLIFESGPARHSRAPRRPYYKLFELVAGARVVGRAEPRQTVRARLPLRSPARRPLRYAARTRADRSGCYALRLPYSTEPRPGVRSVGPYRLRSGGESAPLRVPERAVREGAILEGPALGGARSAAAAARCRGPRPAPGAPGLRPW